MKKRWICLCALVLVLLCVFVLPATAQAATEGDYTYTVTDGEATITACKSSISGKITIPSTLGGYPVTAIGNGAFYGKEKLTGVTIGSNIKAIKVNAFAYCSNLGSVTIKNGVKKMGANVFKECDALKTITIPDSVTDMGFGVFEHCSNLTTAVISDNVTIIPFSTFESCIELTSVTLGEGVATIEEGAFNSCYKLASVTIPDSLTTIGEFAFMWCKDLTSLSFENRLETIGGSAFYGCESLKTVAIPASVTEIGVSAFANCEELTKLSVSAKNPVYSSDSNGMLYNKDKTVLVQVPNGLGKYGTLTIPDGVTAIGDFAVFAHSARTLYMPGSVTTIGYRAFNKSSVSNVYYDGTKAQWNAIDFGEDNERLTNATLHLPKAVQIATQPKDGGAPIGQKVKITVKASGSGLTYTWYHKNADATDYKKSSVTGATYSVTVSDAVHGRYVYCVVTDKFGNTAKTKVVRVYRCNPIKITAQPVNVAVGSGKTAKVTVKATGDGLKYTWYYAKKGSSTFTKTTVTTASYSVKMSSSVSGRKVYCVVTDKYGNSVKSNVVTLYKGTPAKITTQPKSTTVVSGKTGKLTLKASGSSLTYTWYVKYKGASSFVKVGKNSKTYSFKMASKFSGAQAYCVVKDKYGVTVKSSVVTIKQAPKPAITTQPKSVLQVSGKTVKFTVKASGEGLKYQWYYAKKGSSSFKKLSGKTSATYSVKVSSSVNGRKYYCLVTDKYGQTVKTSQGTLTMKTVAKITTQPKSITAKNGKTAKVTIKATGDGLTYAWYYLKPGATKYAKSSITKNVFSVKMAVAWKNAKVYCVIADKYGNTVKSKVVTLKMK